MTSSTAAAAGAGTLGIVDWGIGGLGLLGLLDELLPGRPVIYWSDTAATPYGQLGRAALAARLRVVVRALAERGCTEVVLACNAASTAVDRLAGLGVPVTGIIEHGIAAVDDDATGVIGVVGGAGTIRSGAYRRGLSRPDRIVRSRVAQPLSAHIEAGRIATPEFDADLARIVAPLRGATALVLACTHYPAASDAFARHLPGTALVDPAHHLAVSLAEAGASAWGGSSGSPATRTYLTTGDPDAMRSSAASAWGRTIEQITPVRMGR